MKTSQFNSSALLSKIDQNYKYNIKDLYEMPEINQIRLKISSEDFKDAFISSHIQDRRTAITMRSFLILFLISGVFPTVKVILPKIVGRRSKNRTAEDDIIFFEVLLKEEKDIVNFCRKLSTETPFRKKNLKTSSLSNIEVSGKKFTLNTNILLSNFFEVKELANMYFKDIHLDKVLLHTNFVCKNVPENTKANLLMRNIFFF